MPAEGPLCVDAWWSCSYNDSVTLQIAACPNHPQREAIGICVRCRRRVCSECATKVEGINYCVTCLAELAQRPSGRRAVRVPALTVYLSAGTYFVGLTGLVWVLLELLLPGASP